MSFYGHQEVYVFQTDTSPLEKPYASKMSDRHYIHVPNQVIPGNKHLGIGHNYSYVNVGYTPPEGGSRWSLPLDIERVTPQSNAIDTALIQTHRLMSDETLPFGAARLVIASHLSVHCSLLRSR